MRLDHTGIATEDADELAGLYVDLLDARVVHEESGGIHFVFVEVDDNYLEFLEPVDPESDIGQYVGEHGPGFHHLGFETEDLPAAMDHARDLGVDLIDEVVVLRVRAVLLLVGRLCHHLRQSVVWCGVTRVLWPVRGPPDGSTGRVRLRGFAGPSIRDTYWSRERLRTLGAR